MVISEKKLILLILILYTGVVFFSFISKVNMINLVSVGIIGAICTIVLLNNEKLLILSAIGTSLLFRGLSGISGGFQYVPLFIYILMLVDIFIRSKKKKIDYKLKCLFTLSIFFSVVPLVLNLDINIYNIVYSLMKRYCFIIIYIYIINSDLEYTEIYSLITKPIIILLMINIPIFIVQFIKGTDRDFITGIFGNNMTGIVGQLLMIALCIKLKDYYFKKIELINLFTWVVISIIYFSIAEVKFGFFAMSIFLLIFFIFIKRGLKSILIASLMAICISFGYNLYMTTYSHQNFLDADFVEHYLADQSYSGDSINRIGFKDKIDDVVFKDKIDELFGMGIGSGNPSEIKVLKGSLYEKYDYLKYHWFLLPYIYVESGMIGMILFIAIYIYTLLKSYKSYRKSQSEQNLLVFLISIINLMYFIYNNSVLTYTIMFIYWSYFGILTIEENKKKRGEIVIYE